MRRWMEFGLNGTLFSNPEWFEKSERRGGQGAPLFISMPHKSRMFMILAGAATQNKVQFLSIKPGTGPAPAADCQAAHVPNGFVLSGSGLVVGGMSAGILFGGFPTFDENGDPTGSFAPSFFPSVSSEPPDEFGG